MSSQEFLPAHHLVVRWKGARLHALSWQPFLSAMQFGTSCLSSLMGIFQPLCYPRDSEAGCSPQSILEQGAFCQLHGVVLHRRHLSQHQDQREEKASVIYKVLFKYEVQASASWVVSHFCKGLERKHFRLLGHAVSAAATLLQHRNSYTSVVVFR